MSIAAFVPFLMAIGGGLVYLVANDPKWSKVAECGRLCMLGGFIGIAIGYAGHVVSLGR